MASVTVLNGLMNLLPQGRLRNYLSAIQTERHSQFRIRYDLFRNVWNVVVDDFRFTFARNPEHALTSDLGLIRKMPVWKPDVIIDANPGEGTTAILLAHKNPEATVYLFEPKSEDKLHIMKENIYHNNLTNTIVVPGNDARFDTFLLNEIAGHFFDKSIILKLHLPECSQKMISTIADIWRYNHLRVILTSEPSDKLSYSHDLIEQSCFDAGMPFTMNKYDDRMPVFIKERNLLG